MFCSNCGEEIGKDEKFCKKCGKDSSRDTENVGAQPILTEKNDTYSYRGWLVSDSFYKRAIACWGHTIVGYFLIILCVLGVVFAVSAVVMFFGLIFG